MVRVPRRNLAKRQATHGNQYPWYIQWGVDAYEKAARQGPTTVDDMLRAYYPTHDPFGRPLYRQPRDIEPHPMIDLVMRRGGP